MGVGVGVVGVDVGMDVDVGLVGVVSCVGYNPLIPPMALVVEPYTLTYRTSCGGSLSRCSGC